MFRFTIRDVLWLTVVVAMGVWLWKERAVLNTQRVELEHQRAELAVEQADLRAKRRELDAHFLRLVDSQDRLNQQLQGAGERGP